MPVVVVAEEAGGSETYDYSLDLSRWMNC